VAVEDVVAQHQRRRGLTHEVAADDEGLREAVGPRLLGVAELHAPLLAIAQQLAKPRQVLGVEMSRISRMPASISALMG
jgi:hypothetical protein